MRIEETTYNLNITILGTTAEDAKIQIEQIAPMNKDEFWNWLISSAKAQELSKTTRPSREVWRDTKENPQPRTKLREMDEFRSTYKKFKRKFPQASEELLRTKTQEFLNGRKKILSDFADILSEKLFPEEEKNEVDESKPQKSWDGADLSKQPSPFNFAACIKF